MGDASKRDPIEPPLQSLNLHPESFHWWGDSTFAKPAALFHLCFWLHNPKMNTLTISKRLIKAGMQPATAEEQAQILAEITSELATKQDIQRLEQRFEQMEETTRERFGQVEKRFDQVEKMIRDQAVNTRWMMGVMFVALSLLLGALKLF